MTQLRARYGEVQVTALIYTIEQESETIFEKFIFDDKEDRDIHSVALGKFDAHVIPTVIFIRERAKFHQS